MNTFGESLSKIICRAGEIMLTAHNIEAEGDVREKASDAANMVTMYDVAVQNFLMEEITKIIPDAYFIAEEKENDASVLQREYCFIIDPIDGTANFVHDYRHSCISLALFSRGEAVFAAVLDPYQNELFTAEKGKGAYLNGRRIHVSDRDMTHSIVTFGTSPYYKSTLGTKSFAIAERLFYACSDLRRGGAAALDLAYIAAGRTEIFFECSLFPWDIAAGYLLVKEAGGKISCIDGSPIDFSHTCSLLATNDIVYEDAVSLLKDLA